MAGRIMSKLRWEINDGGRVWTLIGELPWPAGNGRTYLVGQPVGFVYETAGGWAVVHSDERVARVDTLDEAKGLLQTLVGASNV